MKTRLGFLMLAVILLAARPVILACKTTGYGWTQAFQGFYFIPGLRVVPGLIGVLRVISCV